MNLYELFELEPDFTQKELKKKYHQLCILHHPDKQGDSKKFIQIQEAYETLSDPNKRKKYEIQQKIPFLQSLELTEDDYKILEMYHDRITQTNEYKLMELLYRSLPKHLLQKMKSKFIYKKEKNSNINNNLSIEISPKWIYIQDMKDSQKIHLYASMEDSYNNKLKRVFIKTSYGNIYLFLRGFHRTINIFNSDQCWLTLHLHTKNGNQCYRKKNDLYYLVPSKKYNIIQLPDKRTFLTKLSIIRNMGFYNQGIKGDLIIVKYFP